MNESVPSALAGPRYIHGQNPTGLPLTDLIRGHRAYNKVVKRNSASITKSSGQLAFSLGGRGFKGDFIGFQEYPDLPSAASVLECNVEQETGAHPSLLEHPLTWVRLCWNAAARSANGCYTLSVSVG